MSDSMIRYRHFPRSDEPPSFADTLLGVFRKYESQIATAEAGNGLKSDQVLRTVRPDLLDEGFAVESGRAKEDKIHRPVLFGENGEPTLRYEVDAYHDGWSCGLEVEAGRAWKGNAIYRDLIQGMMMSQIETLALAVPNVYRYSQGDRTSENRAYEKTVNVVETLYAVDRAELPYRLIVIGY